jgi:predicted protein tyrosine phosphatase
LAAVASVVDDKNMDGRRREEEAVVVVECFVVVQSPANAVAVVRVLDENVDGTKAVEKLAAAPESAAATTNGENFMVVACRC